MEEGFIAESDTPAKLLESNSKFKALYDAADRDNREDAST
jgi:ABC-type multidrug transport system fused ATPase/permease subunit